MPSILWQGACGVLAVLAAAPLATAQYPPASNFTSLLQSPADPNVKISYKTPENGTCQTVFETQAQYTGYINIPPFTLAAVEQNYSINTFFWFVEARANPETAPLTIYLQGGPGTSSMFGFFQEIGPCQVVEKLDGSFGTEPRMYGWDRSSNVLFIDQPVQVGFSYDTLSNASLNLITGNITHPPSPPPAGQPAWSYLNGTFASGNQSSTANTTETAAVTVWHFLQSWLTAFPRYNPGTFPNSTQASAAGINLFAESYGGKYAPVFASYFETQNVRRSNGSLPANTTIAIQLASVGIINGLIDDLIQDYYYPLFAYNNTYDIQAITQTEELNGIQLYTSSCAPAILACRQAMNITDPEDTGSNADTDGVCDKAQLVCNNLTNLIFSSGRDVYDIRVDDPSPFPPAAYQDYLNFASVQASIGVPLNYTESNPVVQSAFISTGDTISGAALTDLAYLLSLGVRVALIYGDADYLCNWQGGEAVSLALAALLPNYPATNNTYGPTPYASGFPAAGYADIVVNSTYVGGVVRQYGNLSFSRIYDSGHFVPFFQPETAFTVFTRVILGTDLSTGGIVGLSNYSSNGTQSATHTNSAPAQPDPTCWIRDIPDTCSDQDVLAIKAGDGVVQAGMWFSASSAVPSLSSQTASSTQTASTVSVAPTGVYTATATPSPSKQGAAADGPGACLGVRIVCCVAVLMALGV